MVSAEFELEAISPLYRVGYALRNQTRRFWLGLAIAAASVSLLGLLGHPQLAFSNASLLKPPAVSKATANVHSSLPANSPTTPPTPAVAPATAVPIPNCTPDTAYGLPSQLNLAGDANGLTQVVDTHSYYQIYGNTPAQIHSQAAQCAPGGGSAAGGDDFAAETGYQLAWQYSTTSDSTGACTVGNVKVGLHLNMVLPEWQPTAAATGGLAATWQKYISSLTTHENGHVAIDQQYAGQLLNDLQAYPTTDCGSIAASLQAKANADIAALTAANNAYDARTDHGATQGAILP